MPKKLIIQEKGEYLVFKGGRQTLSINEEDQLRILLFRRWWQRFTKDIHFTITHHHNQNRRQSVTGKSAKNKETS